MLYIVFHVDNCLYWLGKIIFLSNLGSFRRMSGYNCLRILRNGLRSWSSMRETSLLHLYSSKRESKNTLESINIGIAEISERRSIPKSKATNSFSKFHRYLSLYSSKESSSKMVFLIESSYLFEDLSDDSDYLSDDSDYVSPSSMNDVLYLFLIFLPIAYRILVFLSIIMRLSSGMLFTSISSRRMELEGNTSTYPSDI